MRIIDPHNLGDGEYMLPPGWCVLTHDIDGPFLDTGIQINEADPHAYIHVTMVEEMGRQVGMVPKHEVDVIAERLRALEAEFAKTKEQLDAISKFEPALLGVSNGSS